MSSWRGKKKPKPDRSAPNPAKTVPSVEAIAKPTAAKRSWRKKSPAVAASTGGSYWASGGSSKSLVSSRVKKLFSALLAIGVCATLFAWLMARQDMTVPILSLVVSDYADPLAPNAWADSEQSLFTAKDNKGLSDHAFQVIARTVTTKTDFDGTLKNAFKKSETEHADKRFFLKPGGPGERLVFPKYRAVIVHISTHGLLNSSGEPCLLFKDSNPYDEATWKPLHDVLINISDLAAQHAKEPRVLVLLDCARQLPDARFGNFISSFSNEAQRVVRNLARDNIAVLLSADANQYSWPTPELGGTAFGVNVLRGLQGQADVDKKLWKRVTVKELYDFVKKETSSYVWKSRKAVQIPVLVWPDGTSEPNYELCYTSNNVFQASKEPDFGKVEWSQNFVTATSQTMGDPWVYAQYISRLQQSQNMAFGGTYYINKLASTIPQSVPFKKEASNALVSMFQLIDSGQFNTSELKYVEYEPPQVEPAAGSGEQLPKDAATTDKSKASATASELPRNAQGNVELQSALRHWLALEPTKPSPAPNLKAFGNNREMRRAVVYFLWNWMKEAPQNINPSNLEHILKDVLRPFENDDVGATKEEALIRNIAEYLVTSRSWKLDERRGRIQPESWAELIKVHELYEKALILNEARATFAFEKLPDYVELTNNYRLMLDYFFNADTDESIDQAIRFLQNKIKPQIMQLQIQQTQLQQAWQLCDRSAYSLPILLDWFLSPINHSIESGPKAIEDKLVSVFDAAQQTHNLLAAGSVPGDAILNGLKLNLESLEESYRAERPIGTNVQGRGRKELGDLWILAALRPLDTNQQVLIDSIQGQLKRLHQEIAGNGGIEKYLKSAKPPTDESWPEVSTEALRLHASILESVFQLNSGEFNSFSVNPDEARASIAAYGGKVRELIRDRVVGVSDLTRQLAEIESDNQVSLDAAVKDLADRDWQSRLLANLVSHSLIDKESPSRTMFLVSEHSDALRNAQRVIDDFWATPQSNRRVLYFETAAKSFMAEADRYRLKSLANRATGFQKIADASLSRAREQANEWRKLLQNQERDPIREGELELSIEWDSRSFPSGEARLNVFVDEDPQRAARLETSNAQRQINAHLGVGELQPSGDRTVERMVLDIPEDPTKQHLIAVQFRGHTAKYAFSPPKAQKPRALGWPIDNPTEAIVQIKATAKPRRVVFMLDCSASNLSRSFKDAVDSLKGAILSVSDSQTKIAVFVFGHSAKWNEQGGFDNNPNWKSSNATKNRPYNDIEQIFDFSQQAVKNGELDPNLNNQLDALVPYGSTPLYLAIMEACKVLQREQDFTGNQQIIAITDGVNDVIPREEANRDGTPGRERLDLIPSNDRGYLRNVNDVISQVDVTSNRSSGRFRLDIIKFNTNIKLDQRDFNQLKSQRNTVIFIEDSIAKSSEDLTRALQRSLFTEFYNVFRIGERNAPTSRKKLNPEELTFFEPWTISTDDLPRNFQVEITRTDEGGKLPLILFGGERIEVEYDRDEVSGRRFKFLPFPQNRDVVKDGITYLEKLIPEQISKSSETNHTQTSRVYNLKMNDRLQAVFENIDQHKQSRRPEQILIELADNLEPLSTIAWTSDVEWVKNKYLVPVVTIPLSRERLFPGLSREEQSKSQIFARIWLREQAEKPTAYNLTELKQGIQFPDGVRITADYKVSPNSTTVTITEQFDRDVLKDKLPLIAWDVTPAADEILEHRFTKNIVEHEYVYRSTDVQSQLKFTPSLVDDANGVWAATDWFKATEN